MAEFDIIARYFAPLAGPGARGLQDDVAAYAGQVLTKDILVEGTHFLPTDPIDLVARKALRVNLSDIVAKGAQPTAYMLGLVWPKGTRDETIANFAQGLAAEQALSGVTLLGGDTTVGPLLMISVTMFGRPGPRGIIGRGGAQVGDRVFVTGTIGDGLLGLKAAQAVPPADDIAARPYRLPQVALDIETVVAQYATASLDISDGLVADARHLASVSGVAIELHANKIPLSDFGQLAKAEGRLVDLITGGDDYQVLFTVPPDDVEAMAKAVPAGRQVTDIGAVVTMSDKGKVEVIGTDGHPLTIGPGGWDHFA